MLGSGRPFLLECVDPTKMIDARKQEAALGEYVLANSQYIRIKETKFVDKSYFEVLKSMESTKIKEYRCVVWCSRKVEQKDLELLASTKNLKVFQNTPIRVLHRRTLKMREKEIYHMKCEPLNERFFVIVRIN
eukprot:TRINITY_DN9113_c0_g2_i3.p3 TRINITY_DN9113_c0_g2~~TRINITY_DN9113_c0_g2_i3.p3  ORF type:complete len:133 (-),score=37.90 TRINITY_DN9113_c0_g2_i3:338-736(-)